jgi:signal transduction histidine kinase
MSNAFILRTAIIIYFVGLVLIIFMSKFISQPIINITRVAKKMSSMDFNEELKITSQDELGQLSLIINELAEKLSQNIEAIKLSNKQLEVELNKEKSMESMRRQFVSDVSHELKNPISVIMAYGSGLIQDISETESDRREYYQVIVDEAEIMNVLVKDLLELSALESGIFTMIFEKVNINEVVKAILENFSKVEKEKELRVECKIDETVEIDSNKIRLNQLLTNLIGNAYKYVDHKGKISIEMFETNTFVRLIVANTGNIIPEESLNKIWDSFYQVDTDHEGNGLGLAIVKSLVELHSGSIRAYTTATMNCFELMLPKGKKQSMGMDDCAKTMMKKHI